LEIGSSRSIRSRGLVVDEEEYTIPMEFIKQPTTFLDAIRPGLVLTMGLYNGLSPVEAEAVFLSVQSPFLFHQLQEKPYILPLKGTDYKLKVLDVIVKNEDQFLSTPRYTVYIKGEIV